MPLGPARIGPRSPAVPKVSGPENRSARSATAPGSTGEPVAAAMTAASSARPTGSGVVGEPGLGASQYVVVHCGAVLTAG